MKLNTTVTKNKRPTRMAKKLKKISGVAFGAPLAALCAPADLEASIVNFTFVPPTGIVSFGSTGIAYTQTSGTIPVRAFNSTSNTQNLRFYSQPLYPAAGPVVSLSSSVSVTTGAASLSINRTSPVTSFFAFNVFGAGTGWLQVQFNPGGSLVFLAGAYETTLGGGIHVGTSATTGPAVPEPSTGALAALASLALGAAGVRRLRRR